MWRFVILTFCLVVLLSEVDSARILGIFPLPSRSHQVVFQSYTQELAKRGHDLVIITPDPIENIDPTFNVTYIDISVGYKYIFQFLSENTVPYKRGVIMTADSNLHMNTFNFIADLIAILLNLPQVQALINDKTQHFDLIIAEGFLDYHLILSEIFKVPVIFFPTFMGFPEVYEMMGATGRHPILYPIYSRPDTQSNDYSNLSFFEMLTQVYYEARFLINQWETDEYQNELLKKNFGPQTPTVEELRKNVHLLFLNSYPMFANNRAVPPNVLYIGATHLTPPKEIPKDLKAFLDNSKRGVIYVSFGGNVRPSMMDDEFLNVFLKAFEELPYDILWKFDKETLENVPKNVRMQQWFPQRDLLFHPNIKAFVTQCGLQSTDEAIDAEVPLIGVPMMADQWYNAEKYVSFGIGVKMDSTVMTKDQLVESVKTVAEGKSYKENIKRIKSIFFDQPQTPLEKAVWWTEYLLRHEGAKHLRSPQADMHWTEYYMLNIFIPLLGGLILVLVVVFLILRCMFRALLNGHQKEKRS